MPKVSVITPNYNHARYLPRRLESILGQTFGDFDFVILDDASTDGSTERLRHWASRDARIRLLEEKRNLGPARSSERVARAASAAIVARMDADDISHPDRLNQQIAVFDRHPEAGVIASLCDFIDTKGRKLRGSEPWRLARRSPFVPFAHGAMMYRRSVFDRAGGYRPECEFWEDQDLVTRMSAVAPVMIIPRALYRVRLSATSTRAASDALKLERAVDIMYRSTDRLGTRQRYEDLLASADQTSHKVDPRVFISLGSQLLWAGGRPRFFKRLLKRGDLAFDFHTLSALVWTAWASLGPGSLRAFLRSLLFVRNYHAGLILRGDDPVTWPATDSTPRFAASAAPTERPLRELGGRYAAQSAAAFSPQRPRPK
jgi:glycosyltransferase involved in cell wall biosynthesis